MTTLDDLLVRPFAVDERGRAEPHHVDLCESQSFPSQFCDSTGTGEIEFQRARERFLADRAELARMISARYGMPEKLDIQRYFFDGEGSLDDPGESLFRYMTDWFFEIELWRVGSRGIVAEAAQYDKELPLQLMLVVGDLGIPAASSSDSTQPFESGSPRP
ncbi:hypothetical protein [Actinoplanes sp. NPDC026670]|uniref:hypothetical protein n=1 Tax=Actinoplanes sp. NPDC026670 TaxID=3154700 RepID=UPI0033D7F112